jgi:hypothetical protein
MDNPNTGVNIRRHRSLNIDPRRRSTVLSRNRPIPHKSNPYVGWFRHAPPTSTTSSQSNRTRIHPSSSCSKQQQQPRFIVTKALPGMKNSPYVGWFRHAPPSCLPKFQKHVSRLEKELMMILESIPAQKNGVLELRDLLSGHLRGGTKGYELSLDDRDQTVEYFCRGLQASSAASSSATLKVLTKVVCWFLLPVHECDEHPCHGNKSLCSSHDRDDQETLTSCEEEQDEFDNYDTIAGSGVPSQQQFYEPDLSVSSQAEAYYAHQTAEERRDQDDYYRDQDDYYLTDQGEHRLDHIITQMDIARMARNASRHLDVESITQLPTITYLSTKEEEDQQPQPQPQQRHEDPEGWSWMMVQQGLAPHDSILSHAEKDAKRSEEQDVCVICLEHFCNGDHLRVLPCDHSFHVGCIDRWLSGSHSFQDCVTSGCPTCKKHPCGIEEQQQSESSDGSVPSWAFAMVGSALAQNSRHF